MKKKLSILWLLVVTLSVLITLRVQVEDKALLGIEDYMVNVIIVVFLYASLVISVRWKFIAEPAHNLFELKLDLIESEIKKIGEIEIPDGVFNLIDKARQHKEPGWLDILFWSRGIEAVGWICIDQIEERLVERRFPNGIKSALLVIKEELEELKSEKAKRFSQHIGEKIDMEKEQSLCELYTQALRLKHQYLREEDAKIDYHNNKLIWYIAISLLAIMVVINFIPSVVEINGSNRSDTARQFMLFLSGGAVGGVLSRLSRAMKTGYEEHSVGMRWMALFLSPLFGALSGWAGIVMLKFLNDSKLFEIGSNVRFDGWVALGISCLLGLSERLMGDILEKGEGTLLKGGSSKNET